MEPIKVGMISLGCSKNQVDAERMLSTLKLTGCQLCADAESCDVVIINTCGFIEDAKRESIDNIMEFASLKREGIIKAVVVTGCLAERYQKEIAEELPEADVILGIGSIGDIGEAVEAAVRGERLVRFGSKYNLPLEGARVLANASYFAYLKVADGCNNRCSFCAIPLIRGDFRSRRMEDIVEEARQLADQGVTELNVVAQDTTRYGDDLYGELMLPQLLTELCGIEKLHWIRILYCYPDRITDELLETMATQPKLVSYVDVPVQHASGRILRAMHRRGDRASLKALFRKIRAKVPGVVLRTTLIAGFPGETQDDFEELCEFVKEIRFERLGCFAYSPEEDTPAFDMDSQWDDETKQRRAEILMSIQQDIAWEIGEDQVDRVLEVLVEEYDEETDLYSGRSYMDAPDIDTRVFFVSEKEHQPGEYVQVRVLQTEGYDLIGKETCP